MEENPNPPPNKNDPLNHPNVSVETLAAEVQMSLTELTIAPSIVTDEKLGGEAGLSLDPESDSFDNEANNWSDEENDDIGGEGLGLEVGLGLGLGLSDDEREHNYWLSDEQHDDMSLNVVGGYMGGNEGVNVGLELGVGNVNEVAISWDSAWFGEEDFGAGSDVEHIILDDYDSGEEDFGAGSDVEHIILDDYDGGYLDIHVANLIQEYNLMVPYIVEMNGVICAICMEELNVGEMARMLPCSHHYHQDCILPWLATQHTCPLCRYELPTDDDDDDHDDPDDDDYDDPDDDDDDHDHDDDDPE